MEKLKGNHSLPGSAKPCPVEGSPQKRGTLLTQSPLLGLSLHLQVKGSPQGSPKRSLLGKGWEGVCVQLCAEDTAMFSTLDVFQVPRSLCQYAHPGLALHTVREIARVKEEPLSYTLAALRENTSRLYSL